MLANSSCLRNRIWPLCYYRLARTPQTTKIHFPSLSFGLLYIFSLFKTSLHVTRKQLYNNNVIDCCMYIQNKIALLYSSSFCSSGSLLIFFYLVLLVMMIFVIFLKYFIVLLAQKEKTKKKLLQFVFINEIPEHFYESILFCN